MFGFHSRPVKTRGQLMREEMGTSWEHFLQAATLAASGVGATVGPATGKMRNAAVRSMDTTMSTIAPLAAAYREGAADATRAVMRSNKMLKKRESHMSRKHTGLMMGLLATGAAVGVAGALVMRRRRHQQWSEYDPSRALESIKSDTKSTMDKAAEKAGRAMDRGAEKLQSASASVSGTRDETQSKMEGAVEGANDATDNYMRSSSANKNTRM